MFYELRDEFEVTSDAEKTWDFFSQAENLPRITPAKMKFTLVTPPPIQIKQDSLLDYRISWMGLPVRWRTKIIDWSPPRMFIDLQVRGPYTLWHHQHVFTPVDGGTRCADRVIYKLPMGILSRPVHGLLVRRQLLEIFRYRREIIRQSLGWKAAILEDVTISTL